MNKWHARPLNPVSIVLWSYLDKVVREESALALARALPPAALHLPHRRDDVARADAQLVGQLGLVVELNPALNCRIRRTRSGVNVDVE